MFFVDDNFAHQREADQVAAARHHRGGRAAGLESGQIAPTCYRDERLVEPDLAGIRRKMNSSIGMESLDPTSLANVNKSFNKPDEYSAVLDRLARRNIYAITSFIFGLDNDTPGVAGRTLDQVRTWPPGLPVFGQIGGFSIDAALRPAGEGELA